MGAGRVVAFVDGASRPRAHWSRSARRYSVGVEFGGGALQPPVEVAAGAVVVGQHGVDDGGLVGVLAEGEGVGGLVGAGVDGVLHVGGEADHGEAGADP